LNEDENGCLLGCCAMYSGSNFTDGNKHLWNVGKIRTRLHQALQPRRQSSVILAAVRTSNLIYENGSNVAWNFYICMYINRLNVFYIRHSYRSPLNVHRCTCSTTWKKLCKNVTDWYVYVHKNLWKFRNYLVIDPKSSTPLLTMSDLGHDHALVQSNWHPHNTIQRSILILSFNRFIGLLCGSSQ
jgi:hypothetical protein